MGLLVTGHLLDARPGLRHWVRVVAVVLMVGLVAAATAGLLYFKRTGEQALEAQRDLAAVAGQVSAQDAQEWRAVAGVELGEVRAALADSRSATELLLSSAELARTAPR